MAGKKPGTRDNKRPWRMVGREGARADALAALLGDARVTLRGKAVTSRKIEGLSEDGLLPPEDANPEHVVAHFEELDALGYGQGKSADDTALRLLCRGAKGFGTERARAILLARSEVRFAALAAVERGELPVEALDLSDPDMAAWTGREPLKRLQAAVDDAPIRGRETYNGNVLRETPEARAAGYLQSAIDMATGRPVTDPDLVFDVASRDAFVGDDPQHHERVALPDDLDMVELIGQQYAFAVQAAPAIIAGAPLEALAAAACLAYDTLAVVPNLPTDDRELMAADRAALDLGMLAAGFAPLVQAVRPEPPLADPEDPAVE